MHPKVGAMLKCEQEITKPTRMRVVKGQVPRDLRGTYFKVGPAVDRPMQHPMDGDGYITKITFHGNGSAPLYQGRYINTTMRRHSRNANAFGGPLLTTSGLNNPSNTNVTWWNDTLMTWYDGGAPYTLDADTLQVTGKLLHFQDGVPLTTGSTTLDDPLRKYGLVGDCVNAHPKTDANNNLVCMELKFCAFPTFHTRVCFHTIAPDAKPPSAPRTQTMNMVWINGIAYLHDFLLTDEHIIFIHHPLGLNHTTAATQWQTTGIVRALVQDHARPSTLFVINRKTAETTQISLDTMGSFFVTHHLHAERVGKQNKLRITSVCYPSYMETPGTLYRMTVCLDTKRLELAEQVGAWTEFPVAAANGDGWYATCSTDGSHPLQSLCHLDEHLNARIAPRLTTSQEERWWGEPAYCGPSNRHVLAVSKDTRTGRGFIDIFDHGLAKHVCELEFPDPTVPIGLHGTFVENIVL